MPLYTEYLLGTDPNDETSVLEAVIEMDGSMPKVSCATDIKVDYKILGKKNLEDASEAWIEVPEGQEAEYRFFKIAVDLE